MNGPKMSEVMVSKWRTWVQRIMRDVRRAVEDRRHWREVTEMWARNPSLRVPTDASGWIARLYADAASLSVRRQLDLDESAISLARLLMQLREHPHFMTLQAHLSTVNDPELQVLASAHAKAWLNPAGTHLDPSVPTSDLSELSACGRLAQHFADRLAAHADARGLKEQITYGDLMKPVDVLERLAVRYALIVNCEGWPAGLEGTRQFNHETFFRRPWLAPQWVETRWPAGFVDRLGDVAPSVDRLRIESVRALGAAAGDVVASLRASWRWESVDESRVRSALTALGLPSSDAAVQWMKDHLVSLGANWRSDAARAEPSEDES